MSQGKEQEAVGAMPPQQNNVLTKAIRDLVNDTLGFQRNTQSEEESEVSLRGFTLNVQGLLVPSDVVVSATDESAVLHAQRRHAAVRFSADQRPHMLLVSTVPSLQVAAMNDSQSVTYPQQATTTETLSRVLGATIYRIPDRHPDQETRNAARAALKQVDDAGYANISSPARPYSIRYGLNEQFSPNSMHHHFYDEGNPFVEVNSNPQYRNLPEQPGLVVELALSLHQQPDRLRVVLGSRGEILWSNHRRIDYVELRRAAHVAYHSLEDKRLTTSEPFPPLLNSTLRILLRVIDEYSHRGRPMNDFQTDSQEIPAIRPQ